VEKLADVGNNSEGAKKGALTKKLKYGNMYYIELGAKGGAKSSHRPFKDPEFARKAINKRWKKKLDN
jgi:hypothetical protein